MSEQHQALQMTGFAAEQMLNRRCQSTTFDTVRFPMLHVDNQAFKKCQSGDALIRFYLFEQTKKNKKMKAIHDPEAFIAAQSTIFTCEAWTQPLTSTSIPIKIKMPPSRASLSGSRESFRILAILRLHQKVVGWCTSESFVIHSKMSSFKDKQLVVERQIRHKKRSREEEEEASKVKLEEADEPELESMIAELLTMAKERGISRDELQNMFDDEAQSLPCFSSYTSDESLSPPATKTEYQEPDPFAVDYDAFKTEFGNVQEVMGDPFHLMSDTIGFRQDMDYIFHDMNHFLVY